MTPDQHAAKVLRENDPAKAAQLFENKEWAGTASYRAEEYTNAAKFFSDNDTADSWYNRGNALAKSGNYSEAIEAYEKSLEIEPGATDALENIELLKSYKNKKKIVKKISKAIKITTKTLIIQKKIIISRTKKEPKLATTLRIQSRLNLKK